MGNRAGRANRLKWDTAAMLNTLARATSEREVIAGFQAMSAAAKLELLARLADSVALSGSTGGSNGAK